MVHPSRADRARGRGALSPPAAVAHLAGMLLVRRAVPDDAHHVLPLARAVQAMHVAARPDIFVRDGGPDERALRARIADAANHHWLALDGDQPVGYAFARLVVEPPSALKHEARVLSLEEIGVAAATRGAGVGDALMHEVRNVATDLRVDRVVLSVWTFNAAAIRFYERLGYVNFQQRMALELERPSPRPRAHGRA